MLLKEVLLPKTISLLKELIVRELIVLLLIVSSNWKLFKEAILTKAILLLKELNPLLIVSPTLILLKGVSYIWIGADLWLVIFYILAYRNSPLSLRHMLTLFHLVDTYICSFIDLYVNMIVSCSSSLHIVVVIILFGFFF